MIGKIKGILTDVDGAEGLIETVSGVSYTVRLTPTQQATLIGSPVEILTYHHVREDAQILFGFENKSQKQMFELLLAVSGVGPKSAHGIVAQLPVTEIVAAVQANDVSGFTRVPGLGKKTAIKIILELSGKLKSEFDLAAAIPEPDEKLAVEALMALGYKASEAKEMLHKLPKGLTLEQKISQALKIQTKHT